MHLTAAACDRIEHSVSAFYGIDPKATSIEAVFDQALSWMARFNCSPDLMGTTLDKGKYVRFKNSEKKARACRFADVHSFQIVSLGEGAQSGLDGTKCNICYQQETETIFSYLIVDFRSDIIRIGSTNFFRVAQEACLLTNPPYGIGLVRPFGLGPVLYCMGIVQGDVPDEEGDRITEWLEVLRHKLLDKGLIRDVYPWNFLTSAQLQAMVGKFTLKEWIANDSRHGTLSPVTDQAMLWAVEGAAIPRVRQCLIDASIVFDYDKHIQAPLEMFNHTFTSAEERREFFRAWVGATPEQMKQWYLKKYGREKGRAERLTSEQVLHSILQATGATENDVRVLKVDQTGDLRELSKEKINDIIKRPSKKRKR